MKKSPYFIFTLTIILLLLLSNSSQGSRNLQENELWTQPFQLCWAFPSDNIAVPFSASDNELIFIPSLLGEIKAIDSTSGKIIWETQLGGLINSNIVSNGNNIYVANKSTQATDSQNPNTKGITSVSLHSIDSKSGITIWKKSFNLETKTNLYIYEQSVIITSEDGYVANINQKDGTIIWEHDFKQPSPVISLYENSIIIGTSNKTIFLISGTDGKVSKEINIEDVPDNILISSKRRISYSNTKGFLYNLETLTGNIIWKRRFGGQITNITSTPNGLFISSIDNFIYLINENSGKIIWKRRLAARVTEKPFIRGDVAIVFAFGDSTSLFIDLKKGKIINSISLSDANYFVGNPFYSNNLLVFPTLSGLYAYGTVCESKEKTGK